MRRAFTTHEALICLAILLILGVLLVKGCGAVVGGIGAHYSDGDRIGHVIKISRKGLAFKSWEGQLDAFEQVSDGKRGIVTRYWEFSVESPQVVEQLKAAAESGARVRVHYNQYAIKPMTIETEYVVDSVTVLDGKPEAVQ